MSRDDKESSNYNKMSYQQRISNTILADISLMDTKIEKLNREITEIKFKQSQHELQLLTLHNYIFMLNQMAITTTIENYMVMMPYINNIMGNCNAINQLMITNIDLLNKKTITLKMITNARIFTAHVYCSKKIE